MIRYFSLFTGIGGLDYGLRGNNCVGYSEIKKSSIDIYKSHYPEHINYGDITKINFIDLPDFDLLTGGFPCQSFSMAGLRKGLEDGKDSKGAMVLYIYRLLLSKKPKYFVLENVKGILNHDSGKTYLKIFRLFQNAGYYVRVVLLNALYYSSAQNRERVIFLGSRDKFDLVNPEIIDDTKRFIDVLDKDAIFNKPKDTEKNRNKIEQLSQFNFELIGKYDRVGTLTTQFGCGEKLFWDNNKKDFRYLSVKECERLQGFPDNWTKRVSDNARYWALGNAVNCNMSEYLFCNYLQRVWNLSVK
jgi:DNA (cytosine-5)-methyltransferase 1